MSQPGGNLPYGEQRPESPPPGGPSYGQGYGQDQYGPARSGYEAPYASYVPRTTNVLAIVSLVTSIFGIGIVGIITGHIARRQIRQTGEGGDGIALAGLIIGYVVTFLWLAFFLVFIGLFAVTTG